ncbi:MAG: PAS domain-containing protein [Fimbriimonadaceae bacterium]|nr:PAS domain-containing protein [Fimbriimonadaceae bacterium]
MLIVLVGAVLIACIVAQRIQSLRRRERERSLKELQEKERRLRQILDGMFTYVGVVSKDGVLLDCNRRPLEALGLSREDVIGKVFADSPWFSDSVRLVVKDMIERAVRGEVVRGDIQGILPGGDLLELDSIYSPLLDEDGNVEQVLISAVDITARKRAEEEVRAREERLRAIVQTEPECVKVVGPDGVLIEMNPAGLAMLEVESLVEARSCPLTEYILPEYHASFGDLHKRVLAGESGTLEFQVVGRQGTQRWLETHATPLRDADGNVTALLGVTRDITARKLAEAEIMRLTQELEDRVVDRTRKLNEANHELESFNYSVSHDLRTPLRAIDGFASALEYDYASKLDDQGLEHLRRIRAAAQRMGKLIEALLDLSRLSRSQIEPKRVNLTELVQEIASDLKDSEPHRKAVFNIQKDVCIEADPQMTRIVVENLLGNAWKYTRDEPEARIDFGTEMLDGNLTYYIQDNGVGFDMQYVDKLFGAFQRLHSADEFEGTGVGLATVRRILVRHGGRVGAEGSVGKGAKFYFSL